MCPSYDGRFPKLTKATYWVASFFPVAGWHTYRVGDGSAVLTPISRSGYWYVMMMWPNNKPRYFGKFLSKREAEKWIEQHDWLTKQTEKRQGKPRPMI
jgi:hypothetical protein